MVNNHQAAIPVAVLSGFLGSGKTTLLKRWVEALLSNGLHPAIVMNELGDVNLDGQLVGDEVPMEELLGGCICCTVSGDLGLALARIAEEEKPDIILIESTGAANPMELIDGITEASLYMKLRLDRVIIVVDGPHLLELERGGKKGKTYRLMDEQIRCADLILLNKTDLLADNELAELEQHIRGLNGKADIIPTVHCEVDLGRLMQPAYRERHAYKHQDRHDHDHEHVHGHTHEAHAHVMAYTHYMDGPVDSTRFENFVAELPDNVYRAKGILRFTDTASRYLFQLAFRQTDYMAITPQKEVPDVLVLIGEHMDVAMIQDKLRQLATDGD